MDSFSDKLQMLMKDPSALEIINGIVKNMSSGGKAEKSADKDLINAISPVTGNSQYDRINLLLALRPFLEGAKREKLDGIISILKMLDIFENRGKL